MMRDEVVRRRKWVSDQQFLDLLGASNLIPGPSSTELAIYLGYTRAGPPGLLLAGLLFILPAMLLVMAFAWAYVQFGATPHATALLYGIKPVIIAVIVQAIFGLGRTAVKTWLLGLCVVVAIGLYFLELNPLVPLFGIAVAVMLMAGGPSTARNRRSDLELHALKITWREAEREPARVDAPARTPRSEPPSAPPRRGDRSSTPARSARPAS
jgi:chromate transporter